MGAARRVEARTKLIYIYSVIINRLQPSQKKKIARCKNDS